MMSQDNRLLPLSGMDRSLDRPLSDIAQSKPYGVSPVEPTHLREYLFVILKRKWIILSLVVVITSLVTVQMFRMPSVYEAAATIQIEQKRDSVLKTGKEIVINTGNQQDPAYWNTQLKLLENPVLARQVTLALDLQHNPAFFGDQSQSNLFTSLRKLVSRGNKANQPAPPVTDKELQVVSENKVQGEKLSPEELTGLEPYEDTLAGSLTVEPVAQTNLVVLKYRHTNPEMAQKIVDTYAKTFVYNNWERETEGSQEAGLIIARKVEELQQKVHQQEETRFNYVKNNNLPQSTAPGANLSADRLATLSKQLLDAENQRKDLQSIYEAATKESNPDAVPEVQESKRIQVLREKLDALKQKRAELLTVYTPEWPDVKKVEDQIKPIEESLEKAPKEVIAAMGSRYQAALAKEASLRQAYNQQRSEFSQQNQAQLQLSVLDQEIETNKQYLNTLLQRQRELENTSTDTLKRNNVSVTQLSRLPRAPIGPPRARNIIIAFLLSLGAGIGLAFLLDYLDDTVKSIEDVDRYIHLPSLALIPSSRSERLHSKARGLASAGEANDSTALALIDDVRSPIAEAYRHLRTSLLLSSAGQPPRSILVTSSQPSEGKTTTAVNTAVMLAQTGAEILIVDCDLRRPRIHTHFGVPNTHGVTNYLSGESDLDALLQTYDKLPNLKFLTSGPVPPNPAELLGSNEMRKLLNVLSERFTHIIIDSPPTISFTDASILSTICDGVMLVVHGGHSSRAVVRRAKQQLIDVGAHIFGVVLNNVKLESQDYYYYAGYYSRYYYADESPDDDSGASVGARGSN